MSRVNQSSAFASPQRLAGEAPESLVETKLVASDGAESDSFGASLAIGGDVLVIGAPNATIDGRQGAGAVYIFLRDLQLDPWIEHKRIAPDDGDFKSSEMCIAIDGETLVVGAPYNTLDKFQEGAVYIFERNTGGDDNWAQVAKLTNLSVGFGGHFGSSIAIQGGLLAVGASASNQHHGQVQIFERDRGGAGNWGLVTTLSYGAAQDLGWVRAFGSSVALDGDLLLIGAEDTDVSYYYMADGAAYLFQRDTVNPDNWTFVTRFIHRARTNVSAAASSAIFGSLAPHRKARKQNAALSKISAPQMTTSVVRCSSKAISLSSGRLLPKA